MYSIFVYVYLLKPQTTLKSFIYQCSSTVVKNLLLYLKAGYMLLFSYSTLVQLKIWEQDWGPVRWHLIYPSMSLHVCICVWVDTYVSQSFQSAISPDQPPRHTHLILSWSQGSKNTIPLARTGMQNKILLLQMYPNVRKTPCAPVWMDLRWFLVSQHLAGIKNVVWFLVYFTIQWTPN